VNYLLALADSAECEGGTASRDASASIKRSEFGEGWSAVRPRRRPTPWRSAIDNGAPFAGKRPIRPVKLTLDLPADVFDADFPEDAFKARVRELAILELVDENTGYERDKVRGNLERILQEFIAKELRPWIHTFPDEFYEQLFRLRGLRFLKDSVKRPQYFGHLTNDVIYRRLAPGVLEELKRVIPKASDGRPKVRLHQMLTENVGYRKLLQHLGSVTTLMKLSDDRDYNGFLTRLDRIHPRYGETPILPFKEPETGI
jgi:P63C domain